MTTETTWASEVDINFQFSDNAYNRLRLTVKDHFHVVGVTYCLRHRHPREIEYINCMTETAPRRWFDASEDGRAIYATGRFDW